MKLFQVSNLSEQRHYSQLALLKTFTSKMSLPCVENTSQMLCRRQVVPRNTACPLVDRSMSCLAKNRRDSFHKTNLGWDIKHR